MPPKDPTALTRLLAVTAVAVAVIVAARVLFGTTGQTVGVVLFVAAVGGCALPTVYPRRWWKFWFHFPTRFAYRRAGTRNWTDAAELALHGVTPADVAALRARHARENFDPVPLLAYALANAAHPDGPFAVQVLLRCTYSDLHPGAFQELLDLDQAERVEVLDYLDDRFALRLRDVVALTTARLPVALARRVAEQSAETRGAGRILRFAKVWSDPQVREALGIHDDGAAARARLVEHLHEWIDAAPAEATVAVGGVHRTAALICAYGTIPLAGWWYAAGYSPDEAAEAAVKHDWSVGQLSVLAALRQGPPVEEQAS